MRVLDPAQKAASAISIYSEAGMILLLAWWEWLAAWTLDGGNGISMAFQQLLAELTIAESPCALLFAMNADVMCKIANAPFIVKCSSEA